jgi:hypothetical protein
MYDVCSIQDEYSWTSVSQWCALSKKVRRPLLMICHAAALLDANTELVETCILIKITQNCRIHCGGKQSFMSTLNSDTWVSKQMKLRFVKHIEYKRDSQLWKYTTLSAPKKFKPSSGNNFGTIQTDFLLHELKWWQGNYYFRMKKHKRILSYEEVKFITSKCFFTKTVPGHTNPKTMDVLRQCCWYPKIYLLLLVKSVLLMYWSSWQMLLSLNIINRMSSN